MLSASGSKLTIVDPPDLAALALRPPRIEPPHALVDRCSTAPYDRAGHTYGKSFRDIVRGVRGDLPHPPDFVAFPRSETDVVALLDWCSSANVAAIPYGGGSSVVGGIEGDVGDGFAGVVSIDLTGLGEVLEVDPVSRAARIQAGALGPQLEAQLRPHGYTLRHFPQSFELSTLGGWLATRSGGHYASVYTHIDDFVESLRVVTPTGVTESRRLPGSGAGPSPDRMFLGSEGSLGIITEAWMRVQARPRWRASAGVVFDRYADGVAATRALAQSGLFPTNCRLLDGGEAAVAAGTSGVGALLVLGFESADHPVDAWMGRAVELCGDHHGTIPAGVSTSDEADSSRRSRDDSVGSWRSSFLRAPYLRNALVRCGMILETFETACPWSAFEDLHGGVTATVTDALQRICGGGSMTCRFTHVYPDGPAPYFSITAPGRPGSELEMWDEIKAAAADAVLANGGTITHHHAVGRDHDPWYRQQRPEIFGRALDAAKAELDPAGVLNPGVIVGSPSVTLIYELEAFNTATASTNKIHDDAVAREYGFRGGLVPGVDVYAYMTRLPAELWGTEWLGHGSMSARFAQPVYDGERVTVTGNLEDDAVELEVTGSDGVVRATGRASLTPPTTDRTIPPEASRPEPRPAASASSLRRDTVLGSIADEFDPGDALGYLAAVREDLTIYTDGPYAHPGWMLRFANSILVANVVLGPWIHVSSEVALLGVVGNGQALDVHGAVIDEYERKGHRFVELDVAIFAEGDVVQRVHHTAIHTPRRVG